MQDPDAGDLSRLLCLGGERHGEEATSQGAEECAPVHQASGWIRPYQRYRYIATTVTGELRDRTD